MKKLLAILLAVALLFTFAACGSNEKNDVSGDEVSNTGNDSASEDSGNDSEIRLALLAQHTNTFQAALTENAVAKAKELGVSIDTFNAVGDITTQLDQIESCIASGYDAIILCAVDSDGIVEGAQKVLDAGIPLVACNMKVTGDICDVYVGSEDYDAGCIQGEWVKAATGGKCNIGWLKVPIGCSAEIGRTAGLTAALLDVCPDAVVIAEDDGQAMIDEGMRIMEDWLQAYPEINVVVAENDSMALGAMQAIMAAGRDDILICGVDGDQDAVQAIIDGTMSMTVLQDSEAQAGQSVEVAVGLVKGQTYDKEIIIPFQEINADNASEFLK